MDSQRSPEKLRVDERACEELYINYGITFIEFINYANTKIQKDLFARVWTRMKSHLIRDPITIDPLTYLLNFRVYTVRSPPVALSKADMREGSLWYREATPSSFAIAIERGTAIERSSNRSA